MLLNRRQFNRGAVALSGTAAMPPIPVSMKRGSDDAYEAIISELVRVEEAAHAAGQGLSQSGAATATGRKLEAFIGHLDMQVSPFETAGQVYRELRSFLKNKAETAIRKTTDAVQELEKREPAHIASEPADGGEAQKSADESIG